MNNIHKVSEIIESDVLDYVRAVDPNSNDANTASTMLTVAKNYVAQYTGRTIEELDDYPDIVIAIFVLCQDMWDNRTLYVDSSNVNKVVESILGLHAVNLL